jgi:hypothetical protein
VFTEIKQTDAQVIVCARDQAAGQKWIEWRVGRIGREASPWDNPTYLMQTVFFCPRGLPGFLYWFLLYPFHILRFRGLIRALAKKSEIQ